MSNDQLPILRAASTLSALRYSPHLPRNQRDTRGLGRGLVVVAGANPGYRRARLALRDRDHIEAPVVAALRPNRGAPVGRGDCAQPEHATNNRSAAMSNSHAFMAMISSTQPDEGRTRSGVGLYATCRFAERRIGSRKTT